MKEPAILTRFKGKGESDATALKRQKKLERLAKKEGISQAEVIRRMIDEK